METGFWILYEVDHSTLNVTYRPRDRRPVKDYLQLQGRFSGLPEEDIRALQQWIDVRWEEMSL